MTTAKAFKSHVHLQIYEVKFNIQTKKFHVKRVIKAGNVEQEFHGYSSCHLISMEKYTTSPI